MATDKQRQANRINAQKSTGPKTDDGKAAARLNALKHGMRARAFDVLPNEDPQEFQDRVDSYFDDYLPNTQALADLVRHAATISWKRQRAARYEGSFLTVEVTKATEQAQELVRDRLWQAVDLLVPRADEVEQSGYADLPARGLLEVVSGSADGCRWLIEKWKYLRSSARSDGFWIPEFEMHAIRLSGAGPMRIAAPEVLDLVVANRVAQSSGQIIDPFRRLDGPLKLTFDQNAVRDACLRQPKDEAEAGAALIAAADRAIADLEALLAVRERHGDLGAEEVARAAEQAMFQANPDAERFRRYQLALDREFARTLAMIDKMRLQDLKIKRELAKSDEIRANEANSPDEIRANEANSEEVRQECRTHGEPEQCPIRANEANPPDDGGGQGVDTPRSPSHTPRSPELTTNEANPKAVEQPTWPVSGAIYDHAANPPGSAV